MFKTAILIISIMLGVTSAGKKPQIEKCTLKSMSTLSLPVYNDAACKIRTKGIAGKKNWQNDIGVGRKGACVPVAFTKGVYLRPTCEEEKGYFDDLEFKFYSDKKCDKKLKKTLPNMYKGMEKIEFKLDGRCYPHPYYPSKYTKLVVNPGIGLWMGLLLCCCCCCCIIPLVFCKSMICPEGSGGSRKSSKDSD